MKPFVFFAFLLLLLASTACREQPVTDRVLDPPEPVVAEPVTDPAPARADEPPARSPNDTRLQGKWQSTEDPLSQLVFADDTRVDLYDGETVGHSKYSVNDRCVSGGAETPSPEADRYLSTTYPEACYYIIRVTERELELSYVGRGNTLSYVRLPD